MFDPPPWIPSFTPPNLNNSFRRVRKLYCGGCCLFTWENEATVSCILKSRPRQQQPPICLPGSLTYCHRFDVNGDPQRFTWLLYLTEIRIIICLRIVVCESEPVHVMPCQLPRSRTRSRLMHQLTLPGTGFHHPASAHTQQMGHSWLLGRMGPCRHGGRKPEFRPELQSCKSARGRLLTLHLLLPL